MSYLSRLDSALRFKNLGDDCEVLIVLFQVLENEELSAEQEKYINELALRLEASEYIRYNPIKINYPKLRRFLDTGEELYSYLEQIGIE
ncbi:hypothetical protein [Flavobacterium sp.]|uniref:hypothetical protein n=1 Tax=Flavobacterium sp. TaxID=239 RepID=UPI004034EC86